MRTARARALVNCREPHLRHQSPYPAAADRMAQTPQMPRHLPAAYHGHSMNVSSITVISANVSSVSGTGV